MPTALVTGATGITGRAITNKLLSSPEWTSITTLSRSQSSHSSNPKIHHATLDLQSSAESMASSLSGISAEYIFFCAYLARDDEAEAAKVNGAMLQNFIDALRHTGSIKSLKRLILVNGLKQYGVHLGRTKQPMHESDPRLRGDPWPENFYYTQQDILARAAREDLKSVGWTWVVTFPQDVIGVAKGNFMNLATAIGLYASVMATLPRGELAFPGSKENYLAFNCWTSAKTHAEFCAWAALEPKAGDEAFNVINGDTESWQNLWPKMAGRYGAKVPANMFPGEKYDGFEATRQELPTPMPLAVYAEAIGLKDEFEGKHSVIHQQIDTTKWAQRPDVVEAWEKLRDRFGLQQDTWDKATWTFVTFLFGRNYSCVASMSKARKLGWTGYQDTWDAFEETFEELEKEGILPKPKAGELRGK
ncbi:hypothetical protein PV08_07412 [Exophiala spinifera]|uniref:PRISE-like Rossmann-fold domain-containing protein n=1 Tax=Exophiala spinifera TaxID=91928 RepID=A0A0D2B6U8_9EURO|nr:uncharacterized protein PV08_07412 [Exophiala spinifera]KIW14628.1 hypothetical protein PV08_07412 [Exophiala spinifera]